MKAFYLDEKLHRNKTYPSFLGVTLGVGEVAHIFIVAPSVPVVVPDTQVLPCGTAGGHYHYPLLPQPCCPSSPHPPNAMVVPRGVLRPEKPCTDSPALEHLLRPPERSVRVFLYGSTFLRPSGGVLRASEATHHFSGPQNTSGCDKRVSLTVASLEFVSPSAGDQRISPPVRIIIMIF